MSGNHGVPWPTEPPDSLTAVGPPATRRPENIESSESLKTKLPTDKHLPFWFFIAVRSQLEYEKFKSLMKTLYDLLPANFHHKVQSL